MRAALVVADVLEGREDVPTVLDTLQQAGLRPVVIRLAVDGHPPLDMAGYPLISHALGRPDCWDESVGLLSAAASAAHASLAEAYLVCNEAVDVVSGAVAGCRPVLVLGDRSLSDVFGAGDLPHKDMPVALDVDTAVRYLAEEEAQESVVGPFPYASPPLAEGPVQPVFPAPRDLAMVFGLVTIAGIAVALGVAYLLQEAYQTVQFPPVAYWLTLQFIDQKWRGMLFLGIGILLGTSAPFVLTRVRSRMRFTRL